MGGEERGELDNEMAVSCNDGVLWPEKRRRQEASHPTAASLEIQHSLVSCSDTQHLSNNFSYLIHVTSYYTFIFQKALRLRNVDLIPS